MFPTKYDPPILGVILFLKHIFEKTTGLFTNAGFVNGTFL